MMREARADFKTKADVVTVGSEQARLQTLERVRAAVLQRPEKEPACTDLAEMGARIAQTPATHVIWVSDGVHGCATPLKPLTFSKKVLFAVMPVERERNFSERLAKLSETYPNATVRAVATLNSQALIEFLRAS